jgi:hypothetical protein
MRNYDRCGRGTFRLLPAELLLLGDYCSARKLIRAFFFFVFSHTPKGVHLMLGERGGITAQPSASSSEKKFLYGPWKFQSLGPLYSLFLSVLSSFTAAMISGTATGPSKGRYTATLCSSGK